MSRHPRVPFLAVVAVLVVWHGLVQVTPHHHADASVPQEQLGCVASRPNSQEPHLHGSGALLTPHPCLACLAGATIAEPTDAGVLRGPCADRGPTRNLRRVVRLQPPAHLPLLRGPPIAV